MLVRIYQGLSYRFWNEQHFGFFKILKSDGRNRVIVLFFREILIHGTSRHGTNRDHGRAQSTIPDAAAETEDDSDDDEFHVLTSDLLKIESEKVTNEDKYREIRRKQYLFKEFKNIRERTDIQRSNQMINRVVRPCFHEQKIACFLKQTIDEKKAIVFARGEHNQRAEKNRIRSIKEEDQRRRARAEAEKMFIQKSIDRVLKGRVDLAENETKEAEKKDG